MKRLLIGVIIFAILWVAMWSVIIYKSCEEIPEIETQEEGALLYIQEAQIVKVECDYCGGYEIEVSLPKEKKAGVLYYTPDISGISIEMAAWLPKDCPVKELNACPRCFILGYDKLYKDLNETKK